MMAMKTEQLFTTLSAEFRTEHEATGEARGLAKGKVESILRKFRKRFGVVPDNLEA